jgi:hypothetical protein
MKFKGILILLCTITLIGSSSVMAQTPEELLAIQQASLDAMNAHDLDTMLTYWAEDSTYHLVNQPAPVSKAALENMIKQYIAYYPDFQMTPGRALAAGNVVVSEEVTVGSNPAFGLEMNTPHLSIYDFEGDKIKKVTSYSDNLPANVKFGKLPAPVMPDLVPSTDVPDPEPTGLSPMEANAELIARWNSHDAALVAKMDHADVKIYADPLRADIDRVAMMALNELYFDSFPDDTLDVVRTVDMGDGWVLTELISRATHMKTFLDVPASRYPVEVKVAWLIRYDSDGLVIEMSFYYDNMVLINQMREAPEYSPVGTWIVSLPTPDGTAKFLHTVSPQDGPGGSFAGAMHQVNSNPTLFDMFPDIEVGSEWVTQNRWKGRHTIQGTNLAYGTKKGEGPLSQTVNIYIVHTEWTLTGPNTNEGTALLEVYAAEQDLDDDGFPDEGQEPLVTIPYAFTSRRFSVMTPPMP